MNEVWYPLKGFEQYYKISSLLRFKRLEIKTKFGVATKIYPERICSFQITTKGYYRMTMVGGKMMLVHRLIATHFIPNTENKPCINHKDGNKLNNELSNLEWCTYAENINHAYNTGLAIKRCGNDNSFFKYDWDIVEQVRLLKGKESRQKTANRFGMSYAHVKQIQENKNRTVK